MFLFTTGIVALYETNRKTFRMKQILSWKKVPLLVLALGLIVTVAFAQSNAGNQKTATSDTIPTKQKKSRDLDEALAEIDRSEIELQRALKEIDSEKMQADIRNAMKNIEVDMAKAQEEMAKAMKEIDMEKINLEVQKAMKEVNWEKVQEDVKTSLAKVDTKAIKAEMEKAKAEMQKAKETDFKKMQEDLAKIGPEIEKAMAEAKVEMEKARKEITNYKNFVNALERDGLLKKDESYKIVYKNGELTVNGQKLSAEATRKYSEFIDDKKDFTLQKNEDGLNINHD